ncbi:phosphatase PAP2 family protein [Paenibacillus thermoaerophilus]|uniref:Phosphatase PAP2 family protein n=1 Tax=Paenibacillus thermoaerophilus TaxID=1215385 RepID=A0ABW2V0H1_9BACL|nr:phosphatase PAP2 family protein [Paenibacillus thermoaerophilus]TMV11030.1 phosphatase PAP2 family protein [Paenibacillus thermoaerophilus]
MDRKTNRIAIGLLLALWAAGAIVFGWTDLRISEAVFNPASDWGHFFEVYGEFPAYLLAFAAAQVLLACAGRRSGWRRIGVTALAIVVIAATATVLIWMVVSRQLGGEMTVGAAAAVLIATAAATILLQFGFSRMKRDIPDALQTVAWLTLAAVLGEMIAVNLLKTIWGRVRFRDLLPDRSDYSPWFLPRWGGGHKSFPSQHAAHGWMALLLAYWVPLRYAAWRPAVWTAAALWAALTAVSRVVMGAHYASDVLFGSGIAIAALYLSVRRLPDRSQRIASRSGTADALG